jgi:hypothetical protein
VSERHLWRSIVEVVAASPLFLLSPACRRWHLRWGATDEEVAAAMPGDELVPGASFSATRAITIRAPPEAVWPWLVQMGWARAGWYAYDLFDNGARPSADRILPEYQDPRIGDRVPMASKVDETTAFTIRGLERTRWMLWEKPGSTWSWRLTPLEAGSSRLVTRLKQRYAWRDAPANALLTLVLLEVADFPMMRKLLLGVRARAERLAGRNGRG